MHQMEKSKKEESKANKKIRRCLNILEKEDNIVPSETPSKFIFVGNAGLTTGADEASLVRVFNNAINHSSSNSVKADKKCGFLESITLVPGKQYSFATFTSAQKAQEIYEAVHGKIGLDSSENPLYMAFVDRIPSISSITEYKFPPGLKVIEEFISEDEEKQLLKLIDWQYKPQDKTQGSLLKHRQVRHFGYEFKYGSNCVNKEEPLKEQIPEVLNPILEKITSQKIMAYTPDQCTVNRYLPGQGIPPHVDTHSSFTDEILSMSLGSAVIMDFREMANGGRHYAVYLPPRSLCVMSGPARYMWSHGICPRMTDVVPGTEQDSGLHLFPRKERVSFTFRKIRSGECSCEHQKCCDTFIRNSQAEHSDETLDIRSAWELEQQHVQQVYDQIAPHFSQTRHKPWPRVLEFVCSLPCGSLLLDIGCGNGKYLGHNTSILQVGCDSSVELLKICQDRGHEVFATNCLSLPYRDAVADAVISIAVIHHLCTKERRRASLCEMHRVLRVGGYGLVYVWAVEQNRGNKLSAYLKQNKNNRVDRRSKTIDDTNEKESTRREIVSENIDNSKLPSSLPIHKNRTDFIQQDMLVPWKLKPQNNTKQNKDKKSTKNEKLKNNIGINDKSEKLSNVSQTNNAEIITSSLENSCVIKETTGDIKKNYSDIDLKEKNVSLDTGFNEKESRGNALNSSSDLSIPVFNRYYHVFCEGELQSLCEEIEGLRVVEIYYDEGNWCCIFEKIV